MRNNEGNIMTREEATTLLTRVLVELAQNAVHNKRLTDYADELERYIAALDEQEREQAKEENEPEAE
jgi:hypothetical protein